MIHRPKVAILVTEGTNCHEEMAHAFSLAGGAPEEVHINELASGARDVMRDDFQVIGLAGGFGYGDRVGSGVVQGLELQTRVGEQMQSFVNAGRHVLGICNGFQVLTRSGLLPNGIISTQGPSEEVALTHNKNGNFYNNYVDLVIRSSLGSCVTPEMSGDVVSLQVAHGEGRFVTADNGVYERLLYNGQIILQYCNVQGMPTDEANFNGSDGNIAGICSPQGNVVGMMPHPERDPQGLPFFTAMIDRINQG